MTNISNVLLGIIKFPLYIIKYFCTGVFLVLYYIISITIAILEYMIKGIVVILQLFKPIFKYLIYGIATPFIMLVLGFKKLTKNTKTTIKKHNIEQQKIKEKRLIEKQAINAEKNRQKQLIINNKEKAKKEKELNVQKQALLKQKEEEKKRIQEEEIKKAKAFIAEEKARKKEEEERAKKRLEKEQKEAYINKNIGIDKSQTTFFSRLKQRIKYNRENSAKQNNAFMKKHGKYKDINKQVLLLNFEGEDAKKSDKKIMFKYIVRDPKTGIVSQGYADAYSKVEIHSYLLSEGFEVYSIETNKWIQIMYNRTNSNSSRFKNKDLIFLITQLSTYLKAGITLVDALRILSRQYKNKNYQRILKAVVYDLTMGASLSEAMLKQENAFPKLLINMVKTAEMTGELPEVLDDMVDYYTEMEETRKQMITALTYPSLVFVFAIAVITFLLVFIIPQFTDIYTSMDGVEIPKFTQIVISVSDFLRNYTIIILIVIIILAILFIVLYKNIRGFKTSIQWFVMHIPVIGNTIIYNEVTTFTKTFASLLSHSVFITDSMEILNRITNNEIYKEIIAETINNLGKGDKISAAFKDHWAFPIPAYEMLVTGENTGELPEMMQKVASYYQMLHKDSVTRLKTFIEPILTIFLTVMVGIIILAIIIPMFGMYNSIQSY